MGGGKVGGDQKPGAQSRPGYGLHTEVPRPADEGAVQYLPVPYWATTPHVGGEQGRAVGGGWDCEAKGKTRCALWKDRGGQEVGLTLTSLLPFLSCILGECFIQRKAKDRESPLPKCRLGVPGGSQGKNIPSGLLQDSFGLGI